jgi:predicted RNA binding protein YcfA (HicA-like mRNA interferase family)
MTTKQLTKLAKVHGWVKERNGGKHMVYRHESTSKQITIPYQVRGFVGHNIAKQLANV